MATMKSQFSSSASPSSYDVFLSFRGEDTRKNFTDHLYTALNQAAFQTFRDDDCIERGEDIKSELEKAIKESWLSIIVFSENYPSSSWCLDELVMINNRRTSGHVVLPVFYGVDPSDIRKQIGNFGKAFKRLEEKLKSQTSELEKEKLMKVGTWRVALREVAGLAGMNLKDQEVDGYEAKLVQKIIEVVGDKLKRRMVLNIDPHLVGMPPRVENIQLWLEDGSSNVGIVAICGMGGIGKTTTATLLYNSNFSRFERYSFIADVREISKKEDGLLRLQRQFLTDICKTRKVKLNNIAEGTAIIKDVIRRKKVLVVLDDVDKRDQLDALLGMQDWISPGSKIIITTRRERLVGAYKFYKVYKLENLSHEESMELFCWHAFGKYCPDDGFEEVSERAVSYCGGLPLAIKVIGSSLSGNCLNVWKSQLDKLKAIPDSQIIEKLRISYDSLQDDHDKRLFLNLACFFVRSNEDSIVTILNGCEFYTVVGIQNLVDRCLISIDDSRLEVHHLLQEMGREIVHQESPREPSKRSILWNHMDTFNVLRENTGTNKIEGLKLDMCLLKEEAYDCTVLCDNRKRRYEDFLSKTFLSNFGGMVKRYGFGIFSSHLEPTDPENPNLVALEADAFTRMGKLKLVQLNRTHIIGPYKMFPKGMRWLCWRGLSLKYIPGDFPLESLVALDMQYSCLKNVWRGRKFLNLLKILNLSHSFDLENIPEFSELPNLERLVLKSCKSLGELHESIGSLERLVLLNLEDCNNLRHLPRSICMLKRLETLVISGCSNIDGLPTNMEHLESLTVFEADGIAFNQSRPTIAQVSSVQSFIWPWRLQPRQSAEISLPSLPRSLVELSLSKCNLSDDDFPRDLSKLCSLKELDLSYNEFQSLPDFIRGLTKLDYLMLHHCPRLRKLDRLPHANVVNYTYNKSVEEVTHQVSHCPATSCLLDGCSHPETLTEFKLEFIEDVEVEIVKNLGLSNWQSLENQTIKLSSYLGMHQRRFLLQVCYESHIIHTYISGNKVPPWFNFKELGSSLDFIIPSDLNWRIRGLNVCVKNKQYSGNYHTLLLCLNISNRTRGLGWNHVPYVLGTGEDDGDTMWLSYWKFGNHLKGGDKINVSVLYSDECIQIKEVGVRLLYKVDPEGMSSESAYEDEIPQPLHQFGNIVPGNVSSRDQPRTKLYQLTFKSDDHMMGRPKAECMASQLLKPNFKGQHYRIQ